MSSNDGEKLYRIKTKNGAHINEKVKEDGSRAAIQFDKDNGLQGPVDLVEVDGDEYTKEIIVEVNRKNRSVGNVILQDVFAPAITEALTVLMERAVDAGINALFTKVIPATKVISAELVNKAKSSHIGKKTSTQELSTPVTKKPTKTQYLADRKTAEQPPVYHSTDEVDQIINNMKFATLYIAAGIRELSNTVITESITPEKALVMRAKLKEPSSEQVMNTINFMLEDRNRDKLDQVTLQLFEAFRSQHFIVNGEAVPISKYLVDTDLKDT